MVVDGFAGANKFLVHRVGPFQSGSGRMIPMMDVAAAGREKDDAVTDDTDAATTTAAAVGQTQMVAIRFLPDGQMTHRTAGRHALL